MQLYQRNPVLRENVTTPLVVERTLKPAMNSTDREDTWLIKVTDGLGVLTLTVLNNEIQSRVVGVYRKPNTSASASAWVSTQEIEAVFTKCGRPKDAVANVDDVRGILCHGLPTFELGITAQAPLEPGR